MDQKQYQKVKTWASQAIPDLNEEQLISLTAGFVGYHPESQALAFSNDFANNVPDFQQVAQMIMNYPQEDQLEQTTQALYDMFHLGMSIIALREMVMYNGPAPDQQVQYQEKK